VIYSRSEHDPNGPIEGKVVEEVFERFAGVYNLHIGGQVIGTSGEHPFYVEGKGWTKAFELQPGDRVLTSDGTTVAVEEVFDTGEWLPVYNLRVADHHTYFVGGDDWGWNAWAHNVYTVQHIRRGRSDGPSLFSADDWNVFETNTVKASADRYLRNASASTIYSYATLDAAKQACVNQNTAEVKARTGTEEGAAFERLAQRRHPGVTRAAEHILRMDGTAASEVDFQTATRLYECGTSFAGKTTQLKRLCIVARLRGMMVVGIYGEVNNDRFNGYQQMLQTTTFWDPEVQTLLAELVPNPSQYSDDTPLATYFAGFEHVS
jgi:hypothetical protein